MLLLSDGPVRFDALLSSLPSALSLRFPHVAILCAFLVLSCNSADDCFPKRTYISASYSHHYTECELVVSSDIIVVGKLTGCARASCSVFWSDDPFPCRAINVEISATIKGAPVDEVTLIIAEEVPLDWPGHPGMEGILFLSEEPTMRDHYVRVGGLQGIAQVRTNSNKSDPTFENSYLFGGGRSLTDVKTWVDKYGSDQPPCDNVLAQHRKDVLAKKEARAKAHSNTPTPTADGSSGPGDTTTAAAD